MYSAIDMTLDKLEKQIKKSKQKIHDVTVSNKSNAKESSQPPCKLTYLSERKKDIELHDKSVRIGKDPQSDIRVKGFAVGKTSAVINKMPDGWYINYVGGLSKPRLNNKPIKKSIKLEKLDVISIGSTKLQFLIS